MICSTYKTVQHRCAHLCKRDLCSAKETYVLSLCFIKQCNIGVHISSDASSLSWDASSLSSDESSLQKRPMFCKRDLYSAKEMRLLYLSWDEFSLYVALSYMLNLSSDLYVWHAFLDGYCSTVQVLLDWFEVDVGFPELVLFICVPWLIWWICATRLIRVWDVTHYWVCWYVRPTYWEVGGWGRDPKKCTRRGWGMGSSTI